MTTTYTFTVGQKVEKVSGYKWPGIVVSVFRTTRDEIRYVVECTVPEVAGALHIYSESQQRQNSHCEDRVRS